MSQAQELAQGIADMGLDVPPPAQARLLQYLALIEKWNKVYNLTAVRDAEQMVTLHLLDSLSVLPHVNCRNLLDVGSGAGLPGIVLAIVKPDLQVTTIDTVQKKAIFMRQVKAELGLRNLQVMHERVENYRVEQLFEAIISRAFSDIGQFIAWTQHLLVPTGRWLAMKGKLPDSELNPQALAALKVAVTQVVPLTVAGLDAERHLIILENEQ